MMVEKSAILDETTFGNDEMRYEPFRADVLKALRSEKGIKTQKALSEASGVPLDTIKRIEAGHFMPNHETMRQLGRFFNLYFYAEWAPEGEE